MLVLTVAQRSASLLNFIPDGATILPAPQNFSVRSTNMKHLLMWNPVTQPGETVFYFVQYQGEYESLYMSHIWIPSSQCSPTKGLECDVTDDVTATVPYNFRVMAMLGSQSSAWSNLEHPFNRNATVLTPPRMEVTEHGLHLVVELEDLGPQFEFLVVYWRMEPGAVERVKVVRSGDIPVHLETMDPGVMYCVKAQALVKTIGRHSAFSQPTCVEMQGESLPLALALFAFVGFVLILVVALLSVWKMGQLLRYSCCPAVVLPDTLYSFVWGLLAHSLYHWKMPANVKRSVTGRFLRHQSLSPDTTRAHLQRAVCNPGRGRKHSFHSVEKLKRSPPGI
uniref:Interleukin 20 receptor subunit beta n=1 Tax=Rattus norvegicus TaxID=10116 RepID=A0A8I5ZW17_RAT